MSGMQLDKSNVFLIGCFAFGAGLAAGKLLSLQSDADSKKILPPKPRTQLHSSRSSLDLKVSYSRLKNDLRNRAKPLSPSQTSDASTIDVGIEGVFRLVLTGGPCAGKSTIITTLSEFLRSKGFAVIHVQETATSLKNTGMSWSPDLSDEFQDCIVSVQSNRENVAVGWAQHIAKKCLRKKCVVIYDRGLVDGLAFVTKECLEKSCISAGISTDLFKRYDCVFHLVTAADGAEDFYQKTSYRHENVEEAIKQDKLLQEVWSGHANHFIFKNEGIFQQKIENVIDELCDCLGIMTLNRHSRRFLLKNVPTLPKGEQHFTENYLKVYVDSPWQEPGYVCSFLRKSERANSKYKAAEYVFKTLIKQGGQSITRKRRITKAEFKMYLALKVEDRHQVKQKRIYITVPNKAFLEITCYEEPCSGLCLLNVFEMVGEKFDISSLPSFISQEIVKEVTGANQYSAHHLSLKNPNSS